MATAALEETTEMAATNTFGSRISRFFGWLSEMFPDALEGLTFLSLLAGAITYIVALSIRRSASDEARQDLDKAKETCKLNNKRLHNELNHTKSACEIAARKAIPAHDTAIRGVNTAFRVAFYTTAASLILGCIVLIWKLDLHRTLPRTLSVRLPYPFVGALSVRLPYLRQLAEYDSSTTLDSKTAGRLFKYLLTLVGTCVLAMASKAIPGVDPLFFL